MKKTISKILFGLAVLLIILGLILGFTWLYGRSVHMFWTMLYIIIVFGILYLAMLLND
jgi:hypothetical protein